MFWEFRRRKQISWLNCNYLWTSIFYDTVVPVSYSVDNARSSGGFGFRNWWRWHSSVPSGLKLPDDGLFLGKHLATHIKSLHWVLSIWTTSPAFLCLAWSNQNLFLANHNYLSFRHNLVENFIPPSFKLPVFSLYLGKNCLGFSWFCGSFKSY